MRSAAAEELVVGGGNDGRSLTPSRLPPREDDRYKSTVAVLRTPLLEPLPASSTSRISNLTMFV